MKTRQDPAKRINVYAVACDRCRKPIYSGDNYVKSERDYSFGTLPWVLCGACCNEAHTATDAKQAQIKIDAILVHASRAGKQWQDAVVARLACERQTPALRRALKRMAKAEQV
jgi:hypothetical protein